MSYGMPGAVSRGYACRRFDELLNAEKAKCLAAFEAELNRTDQSKMTNLFALALKANGIDQPGAADQFVSDHLDEDWLDIGIAPNAVVWFPFLSPEYKHEIFVEGYIRALEEALEDKADQRDLFSFWCCEGPHMEVNVLRAPAHLIVVQVLTGSVNKELPALTKPKLDEQEDIWSVVTRQRQDEMWLEVQQHQSKPAKREKRNANKGLRRGADVVGDPDSRVQIVRLRTGKK